MHYQNSECRFHSVYDYMLDVGIIIKQMKIHKNYNVPKSGLS